MLEPFYCVVAESKLKKARKSRPCAKRIYSGWIRDIGELYWEMLKKVRVSTFAWIRAPPWVFYVLNLIEFSCYAEVVSKLWNRSIFKEVNVSSLNIRKKNKTATYEFKLKTKRLVKVMQVLNSKTLKWVCFKEETQNVLKAYW